MSNESVIGAIRAHHERMERELDELVRRIKAGAARGDAGAAGRALDAWCREDLVPHAAAEERTLYAAAAELPPAALLIEAMVADHRAIEATVAGLAGAADPLELLALGAALQAQFRVHLAKENDQVLPALDAAGVDLGPLLEGMEELVGEH